MALCQVYCIKLEVWNFETLGQLSESFLPISLLLKSYPQPWNCRTKHMLHEKPAHKYLNLNICCFVWIMDVNKLICLLTWCEMEKIWSKRIMALEFQRCTRLGREVDGHSHRMFRSLHLAMSIYGLNHDWAQNKQTYIFSVFPGFSSFKTSRAQ